MTGKRHLARALTGLSLAGALFIGCQNLFDQKSADDTAATTEVNKDPSDLALSLTVKPTEVCQNLRAELLASKAAGKMDTGLIAKLAQECIEEIKGGGPVIQPPDDLVRCRWISTQIKEGHDELVVKFRYYCPDSCETKVAVDTLTHLRVCRDPKPVEKPDCGELRKRFALMDTGTGVYCRMRHFLRNICADTLRPPHDTLPRPPRTPNCDSLRLLLSQADSGSAYYGKILHMMLEKKCVMPVPPDPVPTPIGPSCDSLRLLLSQADSGSAYYGKILHMMLEKKCRMPAPHPDTLPPPPAFPGCDSLRKLISQATQGSELYKKLIHQAFEKGCYAIDTIPGHPVDTLIVVDPPMAPTCDEARHKLSLMKPGTEDYIRLKNYLSAHCPAVK